MFGPSAQQLCRYIAANVRQVRRRLGITQEELAEKADLSLRYIQEVERGEANLSIAVLAAFADALDVPAASLLRRARLLAPLRGRPVVRSGED